MLRTAPATPGVESKERVVEVQKLVTQNSFRLSGVQLKDSIPMGTYLTWKELVKNRFWNSGYAIMKTPPNFMF